MITWMTIASAQQSASDIAKLLKKYDHNINYQDEGFDTVYVAIKNQLARSERAENTAVWHCCMARLLTEYFNQYRWMIYDRTRVEEPLPEDFRTWDAQTLTQQIFFHYQKSLENEELLMQVPIRDYKPILDTLLSEEYRPTLYDFLAFQALNFLQEKYVSTYLPGASSVITDEQYWADNETFAHLTMEDQESGSCVLFSLKVMQTLTRMHLKDANARALLDVTLRRFGFLAANGALQRADEVWLEVLTQMERQYQGRKGYEMVTLALGNYYQKRGDRYDKNEHPEYKQDYASAMLWYEKTIENAAAGSIERVNATSYKQNIEQTNLVLEGYDVLPTQPSLLNIRYRNISEVELHVVPITEREFQDVITVIQQHAWLDSKPVYAAKIDLPNEGDYREKTGAFLLPKLNVGLYAVLAKSSTGNMMAVGKVQVSNLMIQTRVNEDMNELLVCDRITGAPVANARVESAVYNGDRKLKATSKLTDKDGKVFFNVEGSRGVYVAYTITKGDDRLLKPRNWEYTYKEQEEVNVTHQVYLFTDRTLYRPGQTVYYKGIVVGNVRGKHGDESKFVVKDQEGVVTLRDVNYVEVANASFKTNNYGSFSGSFVLPTTGLTGRYTLGTDDGGNCSFSVEEYKRPTFEVQIDQPEGDFKFGQSVEVTGTVMAYAGYAVEGAKVKYRVTRVLSYPWWRCWWWQPNTPPQEMTSGETVSGQDGTFTVRFLAEPDAQNHSYKPLYKYEIKVDVVDVNGETHSAQTFVPMSEIGLMIHTNLPQKIAADDKNAFKVEAVNLAGKTLPTTIKYRMEMLEMPERYLQYCRSFDVYLSDSTKLTQTLSYLDIQQKRDPSTWKCLRMVSEGAITPDETPFSIPNLPLLKEGVYKLSFVAYDQSRQEVEEVCYVTVYQKTSKRCVAYEPINIYCEDGNVKEVGDTLLYTVETYLKNARVLLEIISNDRLIKSEWVKLDQGRMTFSYPLSKRDLGTVVVHAMVLQNDNVCESSLNVTVPYSHQQMEVEFVTFRDKTLPGAEEQYVVHLSNKQGEKVAAELLCSMYDASLDALTSGPSFNKGLNVWYKPIYRYAFRREYHATFWNGGSLLRGVRYIDTKERRYPSLKFCSHAYLAGSGPMMMKAVSGRSINPNAIVTDFEEDDAIMEDAVVVLADYSVENEDSAKEARRTMPDAEEESREVAMVRTNFNETAFFYPHLTTDENGDVLIDFTMPESLTKWRLQGLAHNADMMSGYFEKYVQTSKKLMVVPNAPRFLREGDAMRFSAKVVNMDTIAQCGNVTLQFRSALTNEAVPMLVGSSVMPFEVAPGKSEEVHFQIAVPEGVGAVTYRMVATNLETPAFADGEEKTLPVLTNRMLVTESLPLYISGKGHKTFTFDKLKRQLAGAATASNTLTHHKLTLEFTPNPIWYAIQSMPYLMEYPYECNEQVFSRYYGNVVASSILNSNPKIKEVFDRWLMETPDAFCSNLEKNPELKQVLLEETPWLLDAQRESANKQNLALLFDLKRMAKEEKAVCQKLEKRQNIDGGWSWFNGGSSSCYITEHIVSGFGHLKVMGIATDISTNTLNKAVSFMDDKETEYYQRWIKGTKCTPSNLHYLYARSFYTHRKLTGKRLEAYDFYMDNARKQWKEMSLYSQALTALVMYRNGEKELAKQIMNHIKSLAQYSEEMGMWWKKEGYGYFWYEAPIERQALFIEAFHEILRDAESVEKMQLWLLKQKQTQNWGTTRATTEACYALMLNQTQILNEDDVQLQLGNWHYPNAETRAEAGSGYIKTSWEGTAITPEMSTIQIEKSSKGPAWGALYWQYFENLDKIEKNDDQNLSIRKALYKVEVGERGEVLVPITEQTPLKVGDKVRVRTEIRTDRDMEYVHLKDMRASAFEPTNVISQYKRQDGLYYYEATKDASTNFFIDYLPKGTYVFEYTLMATQAGCFSNGITTIQCMYAPEFSAHSAGVKVNVVE